MTTGIDSLLLVVSPRVPQDFAPHIPCVIAMDLNYSTSKLIHKVLRMMHYADERVTRYQTIGEARASAVTLATLYNLNVFDVELDEFTRLRE